MKTYSLSQEFLERQRYTTRRQGIGCVSLIVLGLVVNMAIGLGRGAPWWIYLMITLIVLPASVALAFLPARRQRTALDSLEIELGADYVLRREQNGPKVRIQRSAVTHLQEAGGALFVCTSDKYRTVVVPVALEGYEELRTELLTWAPIQPMSRRLGLGRLVGFVAWVLLFAGFLTMFMARVAWLFAVAGLAVAGFFAYQYLSLRLYPYINSTQKRIHLFLMVVVLLFVAYRLYQFSIGTLP